MSTLVQEMMKEAANGRMLADREVSRFSATEIREAIAVLVDNNQLGLADALCNAGLSLYPESEDVLAICALMSSIRQEWTDAETHLRTLIAIQGDRATVATWQLLVRVLRCQCEPGHALQTLDQALKRYPMDASLLNEQSDLHDMLGGAFTAPTSASPSSH